MPLKNKTQRCEYEKEYRKKNREKENARINQWRKENKERIALQRKNTYDEKREFFIEKSKKYYYENKVDINSKRAVQKRNRAKVDMEFRIVVNMRSRLRGVLKARGDSKKNNTLYYVGCSKEELKAHIEKQFKEGMSWENYGEWHIDHIIPFNFYIKNGGINEEALLKVMNYKNLQPLWAIENLSKNGAY